MRPSRAWHTVRASLRFELLTPVLIEHGGTTDLDPIATPVRVRARWSSTDPAVVTIRFRGTAAVWALCPDMLRAGLDAPIGIGDVSVLPDPSRPGVADMVLSSDSGHACLRFDVAEMAAFLDRVPVGFTVTDDAVTALLTDRDAS